MLIRLRWWFALALVRFVIVVCFLVFLWLLFAVHLCCTCVAVCLLLVGGLWNWFRMFGLFRLYCVALDDLFVLVFCCYSSLICLDYVGLITLLRYSVCFWIDVCCVCYCCLVLDLLLLGLVLVVGFCVDMVCVGMVLVCCLLVLN